MVAALQIEIVTLFPGLFDSILSASLLGRAIADGLIAVERTNPRDFADNKHRSVDDAPYGGGPGMILQPQPLVAAVEHIEAQRGRCHRVLLSPQGYLFDQRKAEALVGKGRLLFVCGRYEGIDERVATLLADDVLSIGDYVLSGGELAAAVVLETLSRLVPGVLGSNASLAEESFVAGRLEYPQWTRPPAFRGLEVPEVLLSGDHAAIALWRQQQSLARTLERRPDLVSRQPLSPEEQRLVARPSS